MATRHLVTDADPDRSGERFERLERRNASLEQALTALRTEIGTARRALTARALALGVVLLSAVPWLSYSDEQFEQSDWYSALDLLGAPAAVVDDRAQQVAVVVMVLAAALAMVVPTAHAWSGATGGLTALAVLVVLGTKPADDASSVHDWSSAPYLALVLALVLAVVQLASTE